MIDSDDLVGSYLKLRKSTIKELEDYQVLIGFSGFGNVGYLSITHIVETVDEKSIKSIAHWGHSSWFHRGNLESLLTVYKHEQSKTLFVLTRIPVHVSTLPQRYWDNLAKEILSWGCRQYIVIGGLREETRTPGSTEWAAFAPTPKWEELFDHNRTFGDHLAMIGPLSSFLLLGSSLEMPVLGLLAYCNFEEDPEAALFAVKEIEKMCNITIPKKDHLHRFDYSFIPGSSIPIQFDDLEEEEENSFDDDDDEDDIPGYDLSDLV